MIDLMKLEKVIRKREEVREELKREIEKEIDGKVEKIMKEKLNDI